MNILVMNPANKPFTNRSILAEPIDVLNIATIIKQSFKKVQVIDMDIMELHNNINSYLKSSNIIVFVYDYQLPLHTSDAIDNILETVKNVNKKSKFIIIGKTSSYYYEQFLNNGIDVVIKGIADDVINDVIKNIYDFGELEKIPNIIFKKCNHIVKTKTERTVNNFNETPIPNRSFVDLNNYMDTRTIITSRGCNGKCSFCSTPFFFGRWSGKDAIKVVDEIELLVNKYGAKKIIFLDDNALVNSQRMLDICLEIEKRKIKCLFGCLCSINCYNHDVVKKMYEVGFRWIHFGIETGSERILKLMHKEMDFDYIKRIIKDTKEMGYRIRTSFILDYPTATNEELLKTKELILATKPHEIRFHYLAYRVGTPVFNNNKNISNRTQYIHSNKPNIQNNDLVKDVDKLLKELRENNYEIVTDDIDWNKYNNLDKDFSVVSFVPIKYGMCWYE